MGKYNVVGLADDAVERSRIKYGSNELPPPEIETFWEKLKENFEDPLIKILCVALGITLLLSFFGYAEWFEGIGIAAAVFIATFVATWSEFKNEASFRDLQEEASRVKSNVFRNGSYVVSILGSEVVVGDFVLLQAGDKVPADGRLVFGEVFAKQMSLNGEPEPVKKTVAPRGYTPPNASDFLDTYLLFRGSVIDEGEGILLVETVGLNTFYGQLHKELDENNDRESPLQVKLSKLADQISMVGYCGATLIAIAFLFKQFVMDQGYDYTRAVAYIQNWELALHDAVTALILAIIVIVVAVPEGLPMMIAIVLSLNMRKLLKSHVLVRRLLGIETAGSLNILFVDKTGTITRGEFTPQVFVSGSVDSYPSFSAIPPTLRQILAFSLREATSAVIGPDGNLVGGNASDRALLQFLSKEAILEKLEDVKIVKEVLFSSAHKFSACEVAGAGIPRNMTSGGTAITLVKGAAEAILRNCSHYYTAAGTRERLESGAVIFSEIDRLSEAGTRVIAVATTSDPLTGRGESDNFLVHQPVLPSGMTLVGVLGVLDEIRPETPEAISLARRAGIHVVMVTGDRKETATSVAQEIGLLNSTTDVVLNSDQFRELSSQKAQELLPRLAVISRALPTDKSRLVKLAQELGMVVGMTGDGVNDSPALKSADVGFAMGSGSEVAKEAADIVILDNNFRSITQAVLYGRTIFKSIRKFIVFQSTVNVASMLIAFLGPFIGYDFPLTLTQLLWVNLVMDTLAALAFGGEAALVRYMDERPIARDCHLITPNMWSSILVNGVFIMALCHTFLTDPTIPEWFVRDGAVSRPAFLTAFFSFFIFLTNFNAFNVRTPKLNLVDSLFENRGFVFVVTLIFLVQIAFAWIGGSVLRTVPLLFSEWLLVIGIASVIIPWDLLRKAVVSMLLPADEQKSN